jgi:SAM-dependent methyltransferase
MAPQGETIGHSIRWLRADYPNARSIVKEYGCSVTPVRSRILGRRSLQRDHRCLAALLRPGLCVLDIGCGTAAITAGAAKAVGPHGHVIGIDRDEVLLEIARTEHASIPNLRFEYGDATTLTSCEEFDIVTAARTLQWIAEPTLAISKMKQAAKPSGVLVVLDYNHTSNEWEPFKNVVYVNGKTPKRQSQQIDGIDGTITLNAKAHTMTFRGSRWYVTFRGSRWYSKKDEEPAIFTWKNTDITSMLYEGSSRPRIAEGLLIAWPLILTHEKKHYITVQYKDIDGVGQYAIFQLDKINYREVQAAIEASIGIKPDRDTSE